MDNKKGLETLFRYIKIERNVYLFSSIKWEGENPYISYIRLKERANIINENPLISENDIYKSIIPQIEFKAARLLNEMIQKDYESVINKSYN